MVYFINNCEYYLIVGIFFIQVHC